MGRASHPLHQACFLCFGSHAVCVTSDKTHLAHRKYTISSAAPHDNYKRRPLCISIARRCFCFRRTRLFRYCFVAIQRPKAIIILRRTNFTSLYCLLAYTFPLAGAVLRAIKAGAKRVHPFESEKSLARRGAKRALAVLL